MSVKVSIVGSTGYVGAELVHGFSGHPEVELKYLTSETFKEKKFSDVYPVFRGICDNTLVSTSDVPYKTIAQESDLVITALPHGVSSKVVPELLEAGCRVIDHSGDFRYKDVATYERSYKLTHPDPELLKEAVYGLPELYREQLKTARLVANPGCYPTCSIIALTPFLKSNPILIHRQDIIIDAVSGVTGAGRKENLEYSFCELDESFKPYGVTGHRHSTEINEQLSFISGDDNGKAVKAAFTPHLAPFKRGMLATVYAKPTKFFEDLSTDGIVDYLTSFYKDETFVRVLPKGVLPDVKNVNGSNYIDITGVYDEDTGLIKLFSAQDNLGKGAALQAIQTFNVMFGFPEDTGLKTLSRGV
ncbi:MAG: N-acetyl-gamma-glutamyl-phosphate reductase [Clostridiales bacterium]|nr:N-acetyl-gamma-glutamyl-phosphate reductase [Clostridiales bacterium]